MRDALIILNPRRIRPCIDAITALPVDRLWIRNMSEPQIAKEWGSVLDQLAGYDRALIVSDDTVPHPSALAHVRGLLDAGCPVATGYSNLAETDLRVNLCPLPAPDTTVHMTLGQVQTWPRERVPTSFAGFSLTGMSVELWRKYPYRTMPGGWGADENLCHRLAKDSVPVVAHRSALVWHVKAEWSKVDRTPGRQLLVGVEPARIELEETR